MAYGQRGFTLVELLVALAIFAVMTVLAYGGANALLAGKESLGQRHDELAEMQMGLHLLRQDLEQMVNPLPFLPENQDAVALIGRGDYLEFTRGGYVGWVDSVSPGWRQVRYRFAGDALSRAVALVNDASPPAWEVILSGMNGVTFRYLDPTSQWQEQWGKPWHRTLPVAMTVFLEKEGWGSVSRLFRTGFFPATKPAPP